MSDTELQERIWTALAAHPVYMVSLIGEDGIKTRPMAGEIDRELHRILFVTHRHHRHHRRGAALPFDLDRAEP